MSGQGSDHVVVPLLINNRPLTTSTPFDVVNPSSGESIWQASGAAPEEAIQAVTSAQSAFPGWSKTKPAIRRDVLLRTATILARRRDELGEYMKSETGAADPFVDFNLTTAIEMLTDVAGRISTITGTVPTASAEGTSAMVLREPYGVILGIAPWNAPYILGLRAALFALGAGNTVVLKGSELSPRCYWAIGDVFREAGLPDGCLNVIYHRPRDAAEVTQKLIAHPAVKKINFTGSTAVGSIVGALAGKHLKPVLMELGGKASAIVLDDADLDLAAQQCALGAFLHSGQVCMGTERVIVHASIAEEFAKKLSKSTEHIFDSSDALVLAMQSGVKKNKHLVADAMSKGATVIYGDPRFADSSSYKLRPIILRGVDKAMDIYYTESFGPTVVLYTFETEGQAIELANDTEYGLSGAVFTRDLGAALRVAKAYETGAVHVNAMTIHDEATLPHGGAKNSGHGRFNAEYGLQEFLRTKTITWKD